MAAAKKRQLRATISAKHEQLLARLLKDCGPKMSMGDLVACILEHAADGEDGLFSSYVQNHRRYRDPEAAGG